MSHTAFNVLPRLICMMCCQPVGDAYEQDRDGTEWVYCRKCDCWTEHPPAAEGGGE
jgi:hypothetical protein